MQRPRLIVKGNRFICRRRTIRVSDDKGSIIFAYTQWTVYDREDKVWVKGGPQRDMQAMAKQLSVANRKRR